MTMTGADVVWFASATAPGFDSDHERADSLAIPLVTTKPADQFFIARDAQGLALHHPSAPGGDFGVRCALACAEELADRCTGGRRSPLGKAFGLHRHAPMRVLDATAGLGRDAATLAALGCTVTLIERQPALYALLADATEAITARQNQPAWWSNWSVPVHGDTREWLAEQDANARFDAIYIDPMFASPRRKSRPQKALAWLAEIAGADDDATSLLTTARRYALRRVVVKQHARAEPFARPDLQMHGRAIRFDIYLTAD